MVPSIFVSVTLLNGATLSGSFQPTKPLLVKGDTVTFDFTLVVTNGPATVKWFMEFTAEDPNNSATVWFQETAEEDAGNGVVLMPKVVRTFADNGTTALATGTHNISCQFVRRAPFVRLQMEVTAGGCVATVTAPFGDAPTS